MSSPRTIARWLGLRVPRRYVAFATMVVLALGFFAYAHFSPDGQLLPRAIAAHGQRTTLNLEGGIAWLNTDKPIKSEDLKGRIVLLDFWTLCCINCIHTLPDLAKLEAKYPGVLVVIGVHSPKFPNEKKTESIRKAVLRYQIKHPVVNDAEMAIWRRYGVNAWPTLALFDPEGNYYGYISGEGAYEVLDREIAKLVKTFREKKLLKEERLSFQLAEKKEPPGVRPIYFPGKVLADSNGKRLFIADSTHHRIVVTDLAGQKIAVAGTGEEGLKDGAFDKAQFSDPQGMTLIDETLYVADRKNHVLRALDLKNKTVKTVAGTGEQDRYSRFRSGPALKIGLNSPWDLLAIDGTIFIAMAGHHQIWTYDPEKETVAPYAGDGRENLLDGPLLKAQFAQPSGLATDGKNIFVADAEISAIRSLPINGKGEVTTIVGEGLFEFGDKDGKGDQVRLQHALGVAFKDGKLYVADTYNSKIKVIDPGARTSKTLEIKRPNGEEGPLLNEPGGLSIAGNRLFIADTNSHRIRIVDLDSNAISTLELKGVEPPAKSN